MRRVSGVGKTDDCTVKSALTVANHKLKHFNDVKKHSVILLFKPTPPKRSGVDCDVIVQTVNAHLTIGKYCRLTNEITDYKILALELRIIRSFVAA
jgi:hypothetical protein